MNTATRSLSRAGLVALACAPRVARAQERPVREDTEVTLPPVRIEDPSPVDPLEAGRSRFALRVGAGTQARSLYGLGFVGGDLDVALGRRGHTAEILGTVQTFVGESLHGLPATDWRVGVAVNRVIGRAWIGAGLGFGIFGVRRITNQTWEFGTVIGLQARVGVDLARWGRLRWFATVQGGVSWLGTANEDTALYDCGTALGLGL